MKLIDKILLEGALPMPTTFYGPFPKMYGFIERDVTKFPYYPIKVKIVALIEKYRKVNGKGLPIETVHTNTLVCTQDSLSTDKSYSGIPFVVRLNRVNYLMTNIEIPRLLTQHDLTRCHVLDLDINEMALL